MMEEIGWQSARAFMAIPEVEPAPYSLTYMDNEGREAVPPGMCLIDAAALIGCGGDRTIDRFVSRFGGETALQDSSKILKAVNASASLMIQLRSALQVIKVVLHFIAPRRIQMFHYFLGCHSSRNLALRSTCVMMTDRQYHSRHWAMKVFHRSTAEEDMCCWTLVTREQGRQKSLILSRKTVEVFHQLRAKNYSVARVGIMKSKLRQ